MQTIDSKTQEEKQPRATDAPHPATAERRQKIRLDRPLLVEGRYDKNTVSQVAEGMILSVGGFSVFHNKALLAYLCKLAEPRGLLLLTDPDGGGGQIRRFLTSALPREKLTQLYVPQIPGKERRKKKAGRAGFLGVEGMSPEVLRRVLSPFDTDAPLPSGLCLSKVDFYLLGLSGGPGSREKRAALARALDLPPDLTADALLAAVNTLLTPEAWEEALSRAGITAQGTED